MMTNRLRAEQLGFAALPATLTRPLSAPVGPDSAGHSGTAPRLFLQGSGQVATEPLATGRGLFTQGPGQTSAGAAGHSPTAGQKPVIGQGSWYKTGLHVLPEELNAAVLEALAAEAAAVVEAHSTNARCGADTLKFCKPASHQVSYVILAIFWCASAANILDAFEAKKGTVPHSC